MVYDIGLLKYRNKKIRGRGKDLMPLYFLNQEYERQIYTIINLT